LNFASLRSKVDTKTSKSFILSEDKSLKERVFTLTSSLKNLDISEHNRADIPIPLEQITPTSIFLLNL
jgi:hypothetical protein